LLPELRGVRLVWLTTRVPQELFDAACRVPDLEGLHLSGSGVTNLDALRDAGSLRYLHVGSSPRLESIVPLSTCRQLVSLGLENVKRISGVEPLAGLADLRQLLLEGSMWSTQRIATLEPVGGLAGLTYLSLANLKAWDSTLRPLFRLRNLEELHLARWWDQAEVAELRRLNPRLSEDWRT
jgi:hypothetical protein